MLIENNKQAGLLQQRVQCDVDHVLTFTGFALVPYFSEVAHVHSWLIMEKHPWQREGAFVTSAPGSSVTDALARSLELVRLHAQRMEQAMVSLERRKVWYLILLFSHDRDRSWLVRAGARGCSPRAESCL